MEEGREKGEVKIRSLDFIIACFVCGYLMSLVNTIAIVLRSWKISGG